MRDFAFRTMITGGVVQIVFVLGLIFLVLAGVAAIASDEPLLGLLLLALGGFYWRIVCELLIVIFRMNSSLNAIRENTAALAVETSTPGPASTPAATSSEPTSSASTATSASLPAAGWYPDSERPGHKRWWDGATWGRRDDEQ